MTASVRGRGAALVSAAELAYLRDAVERSLPAYLDALAELVAIDCGTYTPEGVDRAGARMAAELGRLGAAVEQRSNAGLGATVVGRFRGQAGPRVLLIGHLDTVFEPGTAAARPFRVDEGRAYGPGVTDMKAGLLAGLHAIAALHALADDASGGADDASGGADDASGGADDASGGADARHPSRSLPFRRLTFIANPDEEIGSPASTAIVAAEARRHDVALVLECARANGDIVDARKGNMHVRLALRGRAAHAGVEPEKGRSAILEAAHKTIALHELTGRWPGVTCNVGAVHGGTRPNIVPDEALMDVDLRAPARDGLQAAERALRAVAATSTVPGVACRLEVLSRHWPMERSAASARLVAHAREVARELGFDIRAVGTGGVSDGNTTAGLGVPTLDGLGPIGGRDHSPDEYLELDSIVPRVTLLAGLLLAIGRDPAFGASRAGRPA